MNLARGPVVDISALKKYVLSGKIRGVGVDVYPEEPKSNDEEFVSELRGLPNTILTPHIGGSTLEAQENIADFNPRRDVPTAMFPAQPPKYLRKLWASSRGLCICSA